MDSHLPVVFYQPAGVKLVIVGARRPPAAEPTTEELERAVIVEIRIPELLRCVDRQHPSIK